MRTTTLIISANCWDNNNKEINYFYESHLINKQPNHHTSVKLAAATAGAASSADSMGPTIEIRASAAAESKVRCRSSPSAFALEYLG
jgi:hypothetical protein